MAWCTLQFGGWFTTEINKTVKQKHLQYRIKQETTNTIYLSDIICFLCAVLCTKLMINEYARVEHRYKAFFTRCQRSEDIYPSSTHTNNQKREQELC